MVETKTPATLTEALTAQFYDWERRGRGWQVWDYPVVLEPPFVPFVRYLPTYAKAIDDGRRPGLLERLWASFGRRKSPPSAPEVLDLGDVEAAEGLSPQGIVELKVRVPSSTEITVELAQRMLGSLAGCTGPVSYELISHGGRALLQFAVRPEDESGVVHTLQGYVPEVVLEQGPRAVALGPKAEGDHAPIVVDFGLARECMLPLQAPRSFAVDPLLGFLSVLEGLTEDELGMVQVLFQRAAYPWAESMLRAVSDGTGRSFFEDAPEMLSLTREKVASPLFACVVRVLAQAEASDRAWQIVRSLASGFEQFADPGSNQLIPLENEEYAAGLHVEDVVCRRTHRSGLLLSLRELAALVHLPSQAVRTASLRTPRRTTRPAPAGLAKGDIALGANVYRGRAVTVRLKPEHRRRHVYVIGATGTGKSTLLLHLIRQDLEAGRGVGVIDPHGDLADAVLASVPEQRTDDVVLFDPSDEVAPVGFNILKAHSDREKQLLSSDLVAVFRRLATTWGDQMSAVLGNAVLAFLESETGGTLLELRRFLVDRQFREQFLTTVRDPAVVYFWRKEFSLLSGKPHVSIITRLNAFLRPRSVRMVVGQREGGFDLGSLMDRGGIFVAKLSQGAIGEENAYLIGSLLVSKLHQLALGREQMPEAERRDFFLYLDEFHNFVTPSLAPLLSGARKYRVGLILAHHELRQLKDMELASAVLAHAVTRVCFRVGDEDARKLAGGFSAFSGEDLQNLGVGEAICRIERADQDFNLRVPAPPAIDEDQGRLRIEVVREACRKRYGTPRAEIEADVSELFSDTAAPVTTTTSTEEVPDRADIVRAAVSASAAKPNAPLPPQPTRRKASRRISPETRPGRGGSQHKYLQSLIKHYAEDRGYRATIEAQLEGGGRVDVLLDRSGQRIACEISIASTPMQELGNVKKCLAASFSLVVVVAPDQRRLSRISKGLERGLREDQRAAVRCVTPDGFIEFLDSLGSLAAQERESTVRGYRVRTRLANLDQKDLDVRKQSILKTIVGSLRRMQADG